MKTFSRSAGSRGSRATSAAAYRAGERIRDERTGAVYDHHRRQDVLHKEIILPTRVAALGSTPEWARTRTALWNAAEKAETRRNARVAREFTLALPHELTPGARVQLAQRYAHQLSDRYGTAMDLVIHAPRGDPRNFHAHLLSTTREVTSEGLGRKAALELSGTERHRRGLARWAQEKTWLREHWAEHTNHALREAHLRVRVSHLAPETPDLTRSPRLPIAAYYMEKQGRHSFLAERIREQHRARVARAELARDGPAATASPSVGGARRWLERVRERAQAVWLGLREQRRDRSLIAPAPSPAPTREPQRSAGPASQAMLELQPASPAAEQADVSRSYTSPSHSPSVYASRLDDLARQSALNWLAYRQRQLEQGMEQQGMEHEDSPGRGREQTERGLSASDGPQRDHGHDYDLSL
ncbi:MAG TPA: MobA/MobL family protein [Steroidobacteraceae bacterium]|nr:MobA/MobL family protein [Steroidobacteraceae bacterium]